VPASDVVHEDVKAAAGNETPIRFLTSVVLQPGTQPQPKSQVRSDLVSRFGEPIADARLASRERCQAPRCELFRTGECTTAQVTWLPSYGDTPERLDTMTHTLGCFGLIVYVPRTTWSQLRGAVRTSFAPDVDTAMEKLPRGLNGASPSDIVKLLGPPNYRVDESNTRLRLYYVWLDGSLYRLGFEGGRLQSVEGSVNNR